MVASGHTPLPPYRLETIFRTNVQSALNAGRYRQMMENVSRRPYWQYIAVGDGRTRPSHAAHDGEVYRADDPFWDHWFPPNDYNCRCTVRALSQEEVRSRGLDVETTAPGDYSEFNVPRFDANPAAVKWQADLERLSPEARAVVQGLGRCTTPEQAAERLTRLTDGVVASGSPATVAPISLQAADLPNNNRGQADYFNGAITLRPDVYQVIERSLADGTASAEDLNAFFTLTHEYGHQVGLPVLKSVADVPGNKALIEAVNELWARNATGMVMETLGVRYQPRELTQWIDQRSYPSWTDGLRQVLGAAGLSNAEQYQFVADLNHNRDPGEFSDMIWKLLKKRGVTGEGNFGEVLLSEKKIAALLGELNHSPSR